MRKKVAQKVASLMAVVMLFTSIPFTSLAVQDSIPVLPDRGADESVMEDGAFYLGTDAAELEEGREYLLRVVRKGAAGDAAKVRLSMMDISAKYGKNYTVQLSGARLFDEDVQNADSSSSVVEIMQSGEVSEYNYSDAVVEGKITAENQLDEEEEAEEAEALKEKLLGTEKATSSEYSLINGSELTLAQLKELQTGVRNDKTAMTGSDTDALGIDWDAFGEDFDPFLTDSRDTVLEQLNSAYLDIPFDEGVTERYVKIIIEDDEEATGTLQSQFSLLSVDGSLVAEENGSFTMYILDNEEYVPDTVTFSRAEYVPENGYITVVLKRSGTLTELVSVELDTESITAKPAVNYSEVHASVVFPYGVSERTVKIPVVSTGLTQPAQFKLKIQEPVGCDLGENAEAVCTISPSDTSFETVVPKTEDEEGEESEAMEDLLQEGDSAELLGAEDHIDLDSFIRMDDAEDWWWKRCIDTGHTSVNGSSYYEKNQYWGLFEESNTVDNNAWVILDYTKDPDRWGRHHYEWAGIQIAWEMNHSGEFIVENRFQGGEWKQAYFTDSVKSSVHSTNVYFEDAYPDDVRLMMRKWNSGGYSRKAKIWNIRLIKRIFQLWLFPADPITVIDENGRKIPNTTSTDTDIKAANDAYFVNGASDTDYYMTTGRSCTISLRNSASKDRVSYIDSLEFFKEDGTKQTFWKANEGEYPASATFELTNDFLEQYADVMYLLTYKEDMGKFGKFWIRPVIKSIPMYVDVKSDTRCESVTLWDGLDSDGKVIPKQGVKQDDDTIRYTYAKGDYIRFDAMLKGIQAVDYIWDGVNITTSDDKNPETKHVTEKIPYVLKQSKEYELDVSMNITERLNAVAVRIPDKDYDKFDHNTGIFKDAAVSQGGGYHYVTVDTDAYRIPGHKYELYAELINGENAVPAWQEIYQTSVYDQNTYYFDGKYRKEENIITLSVDEGNLKTYSVAGNVFYDTALLGESKSNEGWYPASGIMLFVDKTHYGAVAENGSYNTMTFSGRKGRFIKMKIGAADSYQYRILELGDEATINGGNTIVRAFNPDRPRLTQVSAYGTDKDGNVEVKNLSYITLLNESEARLSLLHAETTDRDNLGRDITYTYIDNGKQKTATEKVKRVEFVVFDPGTHEQKAVFKITEKNTKGNWEKADIYTRGNYAMYKAGDQLYVRVVTDRKIDDGEKVIFDETTYPPINTGVGFAEKQAAAPTPVTLEIDPETSYTLPVLGSLNMLMSVCDMSLGIEKTAEYGIKVYFGASVPMADSHFDVDGSAKTDTNFLYEKEDLGEGIDAMVKEMKEAKEARKKKTGEDQQAGRQNIGLPAWSFRPIVGLYLEFAVVAIASGGDYKRLNYRFVGGGAYAGFVGTFRYTHYFLVGGVPTYLGGDCENTMVFEYGLTRDAGTKDMSLAKLDQEGFLNPLLDSAHSEFIYRCILNVNAYAGVGICQTIGVRGGFTLTLSFIANPVIKKQYPDVAKTGFMVEGGIKFWADAVLFTIPVPVCTWTGAKAWKCGYYKDIWKYIPMPDKLKAGSDDGQEELAVSGSEGGIKRKARSEKAAAFVANETVREAAAGAELLGAGNASERMLIENSYDDPSISMIEVQTPSDAPKKILMTYLEDAEDRSDDDRTRLMYTVYTDDGADGIWSDPLPVDNTGLSSSKAADFSPMLCDRGEDILITWISRKEPADPDNESYEEFLTSLQVYTARYIKKDGIIKDVGPLNVEDDYMYANPIPVYDEETGKTFIFYLKSEVDEDITTGEELIENVNPMTNEAEIAWRVFDQNADGGAGKWVTEYYASELPEDEAAAELVKAQLLGERFIASPIGELDINNPVIYDYDFIIAELPKKGNVLVREICKKINADYDKVYAGDETECRKFEDYVEKHPDEVEAIREERKVYGIFAFAVDADNDMSTTSDREIYLQRFDPETHEFSDPRRITDNEEGESSLKMVSNDETAYLFWIQDGEVDENQLPISSNSILYTDLAGLMDDGEEPAETMSPGLLKAGDKEEGSSLTDYEVYADPEGNMYLAWRENSANAAGADSEGICQDVYLTVLYNKTQFSGENSDNEAGWAWSEGIRLTNGEGVNEAPAMVQLDDDRLLMITSNYKVDLATEEAEVTDASISETVIVPTGLAIPTAVQAVRLPEKAGEKFDVTVEFSNEGTMVTDSFDYELQLFDGDTPVSEKVTGFSNILLIPSGSGKITESFILTKGLSQTTGNLQLHAKTTPRNAKEKTVTERVLQFTNVLPDYSFENVGICQEGEYFRLTGMVRDNGLIKGSSEDVLIVRDVDEKFHMEQTLADLEDRKWNFSLMIPITDDFAARGRAELTLSIERDGEECSETAHIAGYMNYPVNFKINGESIDRIELARGESIVLDGTFTQSTYFGTSKMLYSVEDASVAGLDGNLLKANKAGTTELSMTTELFGGSRTVEVVVKDTSSSDETSSGSSSGTTPGGPAAAVQLSGNWKQNGDGTWCFVKTDGKPATGWGKTGYGVNTEYWHFNEKGIMDTGWYQDTDGSWYYLHETSDGRKGAMDRGWHFDSRDVKWYYLDPNDGKMRKGWIKDTDGKWYYLSGDTSKPSWRKNAAGQWIYSGKGRPYGSMYANETTPDGYKVGADGAWIK